MGYIRHHAIIVTTWQDASAAHAEAERLGMNPSNIVEGNANGYQSFLVPPDGSKEGWEESHDGDVRREEFLRWLEGTRFSDGSTYYDWVVVSYSPDDGNASVETFSADHDYQVAILKG